MSHITIAIFVRPGRFYLNILQALYSLGECEVHLEFGSYKTAAPLSSDYGSLLEDQREFLVLACISMSKHDWSETFKEIETTHFEYDAKANELTKWSTPLEDIPTPETAEEKRKRKEDEDYFNLNAKAPRWDMGGEKGGLVNPDCKSYAVIRTLVKVFSKRDETVFDFFSGGQVLRVALRNGRECMCFSDSPQEASFLTNYGFLLGTLDRVNPFFTRINMMHTEDAGEVGPAAESEKDEPAEPEGAMEEDAHGEDQEENVTIVGLDRNADPTLLADFFGDDADNEEPRQEVGDQEEHDNQGDQQQQDEEAEKQHEVETPGTTKEAEGLAEEGTLGATVDPASGVLGDVDEQGALTISTSKAGALLSSPDVSNYSSISESILTFAFQKPHGIIGGLNNRQKQSVFSHWEWRLGPTRGQRILDTEADNLLQQPGFDRNALKTVYKTIYGPPQKESREIQDMLGNVRVDEYGSFVKRS